MNLFKKAILSGNKNSYKAANAWLQFIQSIVVNRLVLIKHEYCHMSENGFVWLYRSFP